MFIDNVPKMCLRYVGTTRFYNVMKERLVLKVFPLVRARNSYFRQHVSRYPSR